MSSFIENQRRAPRVRVRLRATITHVGDFFEGETEDISAHGCLLRANRPLVPGAPLRVYLRGDEAHEPLTVAGEVAWSRGGRGGVVFRPRPTAARATPETWFEGLLRERPDLAVALAQVPTRLERSATLVHVAGEAAELSFDELAVALAADSGRSVEEILAGSGLPEERASRAIFALLGKGVLALGASEAPPRDVEAQAILDRARAAAGAGRYGEAVPLLRQALALAPRDVEIAQLLGDLVLKERGGA